VGEILNALARLGLAENTLVFYGSDNGGMERHATIGPKNRSIAAYGHKPNGHWRGQKSDVWEGAQRVPPPARWPGRIEANSVSDEMVCLTDLFATVAGLDEMLSRDDTPDSFNLLLALMGEKRRAGSRCAGDAQQP
jgi:arylsulfatase A-like enzyme